MVRVRVRVTVGCGVKKENLPLNITKCSLSASPAMVASKLMTSEESKFIKAVDFFPEVGRGRRVAKVVYVMSNRKGSIKRGNARLLSGVDNTCPRTNIPSLCQPLRYGRRRTK